ncbi:hypothetical protein QTJ16_005481 [Diplocarpon rosae]|uniref:Uncharacterized protein n=1 Tax=Diplocarpon rosae TaxID=946125 RepID=A0AAD9WB86_9HELO|nr:hypothetical protein QTJ16_005481 [Diplocarpon rosae]
MFWFDLFTALYQFSLRTDLGITSVDAYGLTRPLKHSIALWYFSTVCAWLWLSTDQFQSGA